MKGTYKITSVLPDLPGGTNYEHLLKNEDHMRLLLTDWRYGEGDRAVGRVKTWCRADTNSAARWIGALFAQYTTIQTEEMARIGEAMKSKAGAMAEFKQHYIDERKIQAIKLVRGVSGSELHPAKNWTDLKFDEIMARSDKRTKAEILRELKDAVWTNGRVHDLEDKVDRLDSALSVVREDRDYARREHGKLINRIEELEREAEQDDKDIDQLIDEKHEIQQALDAEIKRNGCLNSNLNAQDKQVDDLHRQLRALVEIIDHADEMVSLLKLNSYRRDNESY
jgi:ribosomal protein L7/L12